MDETIGFFDRKAFNAALIFFNRNGFVSAHYVGTSSTIGRATASSNCNITVNSPVVSRTHGEISFSNGRYTYRDLNSTNGTVLNNTCLLGKNSPNNATACTLKDGDILIFDIQDKAKTHPEAVYALFSEYYSRDSFWSSVKLDNTIEEISIGRSDESDMKMQNKAISRRHATFFTQNNKWAIVDHQSTNGVFLNGKRLESPCWLENYDVVRITDTYFIFKDNELIFSSGILNKKEEVSYDPEAPVYNNPYPPTPPAPPYENFNTPKPSNKTQLVINISERSVFQRFKKILLLQDINLTVSDGDMVLILGGSGAGKTTFINAVMGYEKARGKIIYKNADIYQEYERMKYEIGFVPQQDLLRGSDVVYNTLSNAAEMKLPKSVTFEEREERIDYILEELGLSREKFTRVSKLSGGQRKRLSIAVEFIANPSLFFLDEPDSGLDDIMGRGLMENLRHIADQGKIVMVITHSPERAADLFDKVIVLAKSTKDNCGHLAFHGTVQEAYDFFEVQSFKEIVKKINRPDENGEGLSDYFIEKFANYRG